MARTSVTTQEIVQTGLKATMTAPIADGDVIDTGAVFLEVVAATAPVTVTVQTPVEVEGLEVEELVVVVPVDPIPTKIGPLSKRMYGRTAPDPTADLGRAYVDYSDVTGVTRAVVSF